MDMHLAVLALGLHTCAFDQLHTSSYSSCKRRSNEGPRGYFLLVWECCTRTTFDSAGPDDLRTHRSTGLTYFSLTVRWIDLVMANPLFGIKYKRRTKARVYRSLSEAATNRSCGRHRAIQMSKRCCIESRHMWRPAACSDRAWEVLDPAQFLADAHPEAHQTRCHGGPRSCRAVPRRFRSNWSFVAKRGASRPVTVR
jgi:hypothetical protein